MKVGRTSALVLLVTSAILLAPTSSATRFEQVTIRPGVGIGPINLGMSGQAIRRALGKPRTVLKRRVIRGQPYTELEFGYGVWNVGLLGAKGQRRVVLVGTVLERHRTPEGLGVGTGEARLWRELRGRVRERDCWNVPGAHTRDRHWYLRHRNAETVFFPTSRPTRVYTSRPKIFVGAVDVRSAPVLGCNA